MRAMSAATPLPIAGKPIRILRELLYVEPTSVCNLQCKMCYTNVINGPGRRALRAEDTLSFVRRFRAATSAPVTVYWCGTGEIFMHPDFPAMVNTLDAEPGGSLDQIIQTNGTIRRLGELECLTRLDFRVSIDGLREVHEWHRGPSTYDRTIDFCREAVELGCRSLTVRTLLTRRNIDSIDAFHDELVRRIGPGVGLLLSVPYTNKPLRALRAFAPSIAQHDIDDASALSEAECRRILHERYQDRYGLDETPEAVDNYLSLNTYGVYSCCHGIIKLGTPDMDIAALRAGMAEAEAECRSCSLFPCQ
jgi:sulfatase maturation enzyme AslB (radical SAM superfamily)